MYMSLEDAISFKANQKENRLVWKRFEGFVGQKHLFLIKVKKMAYGKQFCLLEEEIYGTNLTMPTQKLVLLCLMSFTL